MMHSVGGRIGPALGELEARGARFQAGQLGAKDGEAIDVCENQRLGKDGDEDQQHCRRACQPYIDCRRLPLAEVFGRIEADSSTTEVRHRRAWARGSWRGRRRAGRGAQAVGILKLILGENGGWNDSIDGATISRAAGVLVLLGLSSRRASGGVEVAPRDGVAGRKPGGGEDLHLCEVAARRWRRSQRCPRGEM
eukprot:1572354-Prymnesium_polylepis.2